MLLRRFVSGLKALFRREQRSADTDQELSGYVEAAAQDKEGNGMNPADAMRAARVQMGSMDR